MTRSARRLLAGTALLLLTPQAAPAETANRIVAIVNDELIMQADVTAYLNALLAGQDDPARAEGMATDMSEQVLRGLIEQRLLVQEANALSLTVSEDEVARRLERLRSRAPSIQEFRRSLEAEGLSEPDLKARIRDQLLVQRLFDEKIRSAIVVSPQEIAKEVAAHPAPEPSEDRVRASHILVRVDERRSEAQALALIKQIHQQLLQGADFAALAARYSEDPHAEQGGAMGWTAKGDLMPELDGALFGLTVGAVSEPIQTRLGFHLVKVHERRAASSLAPGDAHHAVHERLFQRKFEQALQRWLNELVDRAYIEILDEPDGSS